MAKTFISVSKGLSMLQFFPSGKYKNCRVDSIVDQDPKYIEYTRINFGTLYDREVLDRTKKNLEADATAARLDTERQLRVFHGAYNPFTKEYEAGRVSYFNDMDDDIPF